MTTKGQPSPARDAIIASIRSSLAASKPFDAEHQQHHRPGPGEPGVPKMAEISRDALLDNFEKNLSSVGAYCTVVRNKGEAADIVRSVIQKVAARLVAVSDSILVSSILPEDAAVEFIANAPVDILFDCDLGITSAQWAIAETGTLVLESDAETSRLTSLVPRVHLCIIEAGKIRQTLGEILSLTQRPLSPAITFITGASRTSDIELTLAIGVHGPAELYVIVIADQ